MRWQACSAARARALWIVAQVRLENARAEIEYGRTPGNFDHVIVNDAIDSAFAQLCSALSVQPQPQPPLAVSRPNPSETIEPVWAQAQPVDVTISDEIVRLTQAVLSCVAAGDREVFRSLCHVQMTSFSNQARGHLLTGLAFHEHDFDDFDTAGPSGGPRIAEILTETILEPHVRLLGENAAIASAVRLVRNGRQTSTFEETCVWERDAACRWWLVHWHRSDSGITPS